MLATTVIPPRFYVLYTAPDISVGVVTVKMQNLGWIPEKDMKYSFSLKRTHRFAARPVFYSVGTQDNIPGTKRLGCENIISFPSNVEVSNAWRNTSTYPYAFVNWSLTF